MPTLLASEAVEAGWLQVVKYLDVRRRPSLPPKSLFVSGRELKKSKGRYVRQVEQGGREYPTIGMFHDAVLSSIYT